MIISLFDALTIAPMLSAYFAGKQQKLGEGKGIMDRLTDPMLLAFENTYQKLENGYERILKWVLRKPILTLFISTVIFVLSMSTGKFVPKTFLPPQDNGEFSVDIDLPPGTSLNAMNEMAQKIDTVLRANPEVAISALTVGNRDAEANVASFFVQLVPTGKRSMNTSQFKEKLRQQLKPYAEANPKVKDYDAVGGGQRPFNLNIIGPDQEQLEA